MDCDQRGVSLITERLAAGVTTVAFGGEGTYEQKGGSAYEEEHTFRCDADGSADSHRRGAGQPFAAG